MRKRTHENSQIYWHTLFCFGSNSGLYTNIQPKLRHALLLILPHYCAKFRMDAGFYHYKGSFTTPPCTENIEYLVMDTPVQVWPSTQPNLMPYYCGWLLQMTAEQLKRLRDKVGYPGSARPTQVRREFSSLIVSFLLLFDCRCCIILTPVSIFGWWLQKSNGRVITHYSKPNGHPPFRWARVTRTRTTHKHTSIYVTLVHPDRIHLKILIAFWPLLISFRPVGMPFRPFFISFFADLHSSVPLAKQEQSTYKPQPPEWVLATHCSDQEHHRWVDNPSAMARAKGGRSVCTRRLGRVLCASWTWGAFSARPELYIIRIFILVVCSRALGSSSETSSKYSKKFDDKCPVDAVSACS